MALSKGDDYPIHQTAEPIAYAGTDRNFYDRYFFNGYARSSNDALGDVMFGVAFGVYPHLNIADASFVILANGVETALHASKYLGMERMDLTIGPIRIEVIEPLVTLKVFVDAPDQGLKAEIIFTARSHPIEEPRFTRRIGPRTFMDYTRMTQNGHYRGWIERDGMRMSIDTFWGTRDRSWGVRPIGARDPQENVPPVPPQFFWLWAPCNFDEVSLFFHTNDDDNGAPWNRRGVYVPDMGPALEVEHGLKAEIAWQSGTRHAQQATVILPHAQGDMRLEIKPGLKFQMMGLGYTHPTWGHGMNHGALAVEREDFTLATIDPRLPQNLHIQALSDVTLTLGDGRALKGRGVFEQLAIGPHVPSGFKSILDMAP
jgi:hypothetical protein